ncbi:MAG: hypothetical protein KDD51_16185 [Bdellovibrionales bacterium]|nr:hypothetical protein [Bdellovibrionales bacterium]
MWNLPCSSRHLLLSLFFLLGFNPELTAQDDPKLTHWPDYETLYYREGERAVYAENLDGIPGRVTLISDYPGFDVEGGLSISPFSLEEVSRLYSRWLHSKESPPAASTKERIEKALVAAGYINPKDPDAPVPALTEKSPHAAAREAQPKIAPDYRRNNNKTPAEVRIRLAGAPAAQLYSRLEAIKPVRSSVRAENGATETLWKKHIQHGNFELTVTHKGDTPEVVEVKDFMDEAVITTANNRNSFDGEYRQVIEMSGPAAKMVWEGLGKEEVKDGPADTIYFSRYEGQEELMLCLRPYEGKVYMHLEWQVTSLPDGLHYLSYYPIPRLALTHEYIDFTGRIVPSNFNPGPAGWAPSSGRGVSRLQK